MLFPLQIMPLKVGKANWLVDFIFSTLGTNGLINQSCALGVCGSFINPLVPRVPKIKIRKLADFYWLIL